jgi:hypothetical protein
LNIGEGYSIVAAPNSTSLLGAWTNTSGTNVTVTNGTTLKFIMESNTFIQAYFVSNIFQDAGIHGAYNGLFYVTTNIGFDTAGMLANLVVSTKGTFSGRLLLAGGSYALNGSFNGFGFATNQVTRSQALGGPVTVEMALATNGTGVISGTVAFAGGAEASLLATLTAVASGTTDYTLLLLPPTNAPGPVGDGYALIADHGGTVTLNFGLADGTTFNQTVPASQSNDVPVYASLYGKTGFLLGWLNLTNLDSAGAGEGLTWIKGLQAHPTALFPDGFTETLQTEGAPWINPGSLALPTANTLTISNADLDLTYTAAVSDGDKIIIDTSETNNSTNAMSGTVNLKTGQIQITFSTGDGKSTSKGYGAIVQNTTNWGGYFVTKTNTGSITLQP